MEKPFCSRRGDLTWMKHFVAERSNFVAERSNFAEMSNFVEETFFSKEEYFCRGNFCVRSHVEEKSFGVKKHCVVKSFEGERFVSAPVL